MLRLDSAATAAIVQVKEMSKFCPFFFSGPRNTRVSCIEDECACWRTVPPTTPETGAQMMVAAENPAAKRQEDAGPRPATVPPNWEFVPYDGENPAGWVEPPESARKRAIGFCGLGGAPLAGAPLKT
jgi:hypothetical protein